MEESLVYLRKPTQVSHSRLAAKNPIKCRRCGVDSSQVRIHTCKTNPVKEHKCNELDEYTRKTESAQGNAIVGDCELEVQEQDEGWETTTSRTKRTRCMNSLENADVFEKSDKDFLKLSSTAARTSSKSTGCDSSASNSADPDRDQVSEPSGRKGVVGRKKLKLIEELKSHNNQHTFNEKDQNRDAIDTKTRDCSDLEAEKLHQSSFASNCVDATNVMEIVLVDVQLTVNANPRAENVPFVSLTSEAYGIADMGYPLDVKETRDGSETSLLSKESDECKLFGDRGSRFDKLVWRTSKRTPVCYVTSSVSASGQASKNVKDSMLPAAENGLLRKEKPLMKLLKNTKQFNQGTTARNKACVPVELIFSKILAAVH